MGPVRAILIVVATIGLWVGLYVGLLLLLTAAGESPLSCEEGLEHLCGPVTEFIFDTGPLVFVVLLALAAAIVWALDRAIARRMSRG